MNKEIQGLEDYSYDEIVDLINDFVIDRIWDSGHSADDVKLNDIRLHGSRLRNQAKADSDLDAVVEYDGDIREDDFFNILNDDPLYIDDVRVDINPIKEDIDLYMKRSADYDRHKLGLESICKDNSRMIRKYTPTLEERISRLERLCKRTRKPINEAGLLIDTVLATITKNLPLMLDTLDKFNEILKTDQITDQSEKVKKIEEFTKLGEEIIEMLNTFNKK